MPKEMRAIEKAMIYRNISNKMIIKEGDSLKEIAEKMYKELDLKDKPLILFACDHSIKTLPGWEKSQNSLLELSKDSKLAVIKGSNHISILQEHAEEIVKGIRELIAKSRKKQPHQQLSS
jgi:hypothetical protein